METERIIELFLGLILVALLVIGVMLALNSSGFKTSPNYSSSQPQVVNYYNEYTTNNYQNPSQTIAQGKVVYNYPEGVVYKKYDVFWDNKYKWEEDEDLEERELDYSSYGKTVRREGVFGNRVYDFEVYVKNEDDFGGYFEVVYYLENCQGKKYIETITKYIRSGEKEKFVYTSLGFDKEFCDWDYSVNPDEITDSRDWDYLNKDYKIMYVSR
jgi:hypothetical protein